MKYQRVLLKPLHPFVGDMKRWSESWEKTLSGCLCWDVFMGFGGFAGEGASLYVLVFSTFSSLSTSLCPLPCSLVLWQSKVLVSVSVTSPDLFHVVLRYVNRGGSDVLGRVSVVEDGWNYFCANCKCRWGQWITAPPPHFLLSWFPRLAEDWNTLEHYSSEVTLQTKSKIKNHILIYIEKPLFRINSCSTCSVWIQQNICWWWNRTFLSVCLIHKHLFRLNLLAI